MNQPCSLDRLRSDVLQLFDAVWSAKSSTFSETSIFQKLQMQALIERIADETYLRFLYDSLRQQQEQLRK